VIEPELPIMRNTKNIKRSLDRLRIKIKAVEALWRAHMLSPTPRSERAFDFAMAAGYSALANGGNRNSAQSSWIKPFVRAANRRLNNVRRDIFRDGKFVLAPIPATAWAKPEQIISRSPLVTLHYPDWLELDGPLN
jgi:hypothetical protein